MGEQKLFSRSFTRMMLNLTTFLYSNDKQNHYLCDIPYIYNVQPPMAPACPHVTVPHWTISGRVTVGETHNPNTWASIQHQPTRTVPTHATIM